ncbi:hypothetical protein DIE11_23290 [Burkholderia sp. Bp9012]|nr:hypothetical protein DIE11_23290 [Burkholderia sp. Bp9012]
MPVTMRVFRRDRKTMHIRSRKAPPRAKQPAMLPRLGTALNWVPPKQSSVAKSHQKKRTTSPR